MNDRSLLNPIGRKGIFSFSTTPQGGSRSTRTTINLRTTLACEAYPVESTSNPTIRILRKMGTVVEGSQGLWPAKEWPAKETKLSPWRCHSRRVCSRSGALELDHMQGTARISHGQKDAGDVAGLYVKRVRSCIHPPSLRVHTDRFSSCSLNLGLQTSNSLNESDI